ncbi:hypothetical protein BV898_01291 [Hypsibius exemplaris]|uniref:Uncharacterized protein n=1 Tax=Hypsibius exemplaris TaxID=2072580 RepID=A0A1W0XB08_HYPEX|nr:hypothetical protein BV898_01291 [Hypsibius exemplaris]
MGDATKDLSSLLVIGLVLGMVQVCYTQAYGASSNPLTGEDLFKSLLAAFAQSVIDIRTSVAANQNVTLQCPLDSARCTADNSTGFFLSIILSVDRDFQVVSEILQGSVHTDTGAKCLDVIAIIAQNMNDSIEHENDAILGAATGLPLQGEQLYQQQLQNLGKTFNSVLKAGRANRSTPNPGKWLSIVLGWTQDYDDIQDVTRNKDVSSRCQAVALHVSQDSNLFLEALS